MAYVVDIESFAPEDLRDCCASGDVSEACAYVVRKYAAQLSAIPTEALPAHLEQCGAWEPEDLAEMDRGQLLSLLIHTEAEGFLETGTIWID